MTNTFRTIALALRDHVGTTYDLLAAADSVEKALDLGTPDEFSPEALDRKGRESVAVMEHIFAGKKIYAIKEHRTLTGARLKEAKESVERIEREPVVAAALSVINNRQAEHNIEVSRLKAVIDRYENPWKNYHNDSDEPPF